MIFYHKIHIDHRLTIIPNAWLISGSTFSYTLVICILAVLLVLSKITSTNDTTPFVSIIENDISSFAAFCFLKTILTLFAESLATNCVK